MVKGSSGFDKGGNGKTSFARMSLDGKTGTEKQKAYAESLAESARMTAKANGIAGIIKESGRMDRYVPKDDAEAVRGAYKMLSFAVSNASTYGQVIDILKTREVLDFSKDVSRAAKMQGKSVDAYVKDSIEETKKRLRSQKK